MGRERLDTRRQNVSFPLEWQNKRYEITCGLYEDGRVAEAFVSNTKAGTDIAGICRDTAIIFSLALQFGCPIGTITAALTRDEQGQAASLVGALVDAVSVNANFNK